MLSSNSACGSQWAQFSTAPPPVSLCSLPGLPRPPLSSYPGRVQEPNRVPDPEGALPPPAQPWGRCGRGRPPRRWRWTGGTGPGSSGRPPGPGSSAPRAGPARTACACGGTRSPSWCRSWGWWRRQPCSRWRSPRPCWWERHAEICQRLDEKKQSFTVGVKPLWE